MCLRAVDEWQSLGLPHDAAALLLSTVDEPGDAGAAVAASVARLMPDAGRSPSSRRSPDEIERLFLARRLAYPALERLGPVLTEDICVPRRAVPEMLGAHPRHRRRARRRHRDDRPRRRRQPASADHRARGR